MSQDVGSEEEKNYVWIEDKVFGYLKVKQPTPAEIENKKKKPSKESKVIEIGDLVYVKDVGQGKVKRINTEEKKTDVEVPNSNVLVGVPLSDVSAEKLYKISIQTEHETIQKEIKLDLNSYCYNLNDKIKEEIENADISFITLFSQSKILSIAHKPEPKQDISVVLIKKETEAKEEAGEEIKKDDDNEGKKEEEMQENCGAVIEENPVEVVQPEIPVDTPEEKTPDPPVVAVDENQTSQSTEVINIQAPVVSEQPNPPVDLPTAGIEPTESQDNDPNTESKPEQQPEEASNQTQQDGIGEALPNQTETSELTAVEKPVEEPPAPEKSDFVWTETLENTEDQITLNRLAKLGEYDQNLFTDIEVYVESSKGYKYAQCFDHILAKEGTPSTEFTTLISITTPIILRGIGVIGPAPSIIGKPILDFTIVVDNISSGQQTWVRIKKEGPSERCNFYYFETPVICRALDQIRFLYDKSPGVSCRGRFLTIVKEDPPFFGLEGTRFSIENEKNTLIAGICYTLQTEESVVDN